MAKALPCVRMSVILYVLAREKLKYGVKLLLQYWLSFRLFSIQISKQISRKQQFQSVISLNLQARFVVYLNLMRFYGQRSIKSVQKIIFTVKTSAPCKKHSFMTLLAAGFAAKILLILMASSSVATCLAHSKLCSSAHPESDAP